MHIAGICPPVSSRRNVAGGSSVPSSCFEDLGSISGTPCWFCMCSRPWSYPANFRNLVGCIDDLILLPSKNSCSSKEMLLPHGALTFSLFSEYRGSQKYWKTSLKWRVFTTQLRVSTWQHQKPKHGAVLITLQTPFCYLICFFKKQQQSAYKYHLQDSSPVAGCSVVVFGTWVNDLFLSKRSQAIQV